MNYTMISPDGETWLAESDNWEDAYAEAKSWFGSAASVRQSFYKEWNCGDLDQGHRCGYDKYGVHLTQDEHRKRIWVSANNESMLIRLPFGKGLVIGQGAYFGSWRNARWEFADHDGFEDTKNHVVIQGGLGK